MSPLVSMVGGGKHAWVRECNKKADKVHVWVEEAERWLDEAP
ncbi:MAG TPA: hypothetical protein VHC22_33895 [Pirellulales bacterium]|nr:hypothetical protein [Pirellulales bacterium]